MANRVWQDHWMGGTITIRCHLALQDRFKAVAKKQGSSMSKLGRQMVIDYIAFYEANKAVEKDE